VITVTKSGKAKWASLKSPNKEGSHNQEAIMNSSHFKELAQIGIALSREKDINKLFEIIVDEARSLTGADGGTLYLIDKRKMQLRFEILHNDTMKMRMGGTTGVEITLPPVPLFNTGQPNYANVSSYVALTGTIVNVPDLYEAEGFDFTGASMYDDRTGYRSQSMLVIPMKSHEDDVIGVLQLLNARDPKSNKVISFDPQSVDSIASLASQAAVALTNRQLFEELVEAKRRTERAFLDTVQRLAIVAAYKDKETALHVKRMSRYSAILAGGLCLSPAQADIVLHGSQMHDVGKIGIPDAILLKPAKLDAREWDIMKQHTTIGGHMLSGSPSELMQAGRTIALSHHERWDGSGYPKGLEKEDIPLLGRICAVADVFDAVTTRRPYREAYSTQEAYKFLREGRGKQFDPRVVDVFFARLDEIVAIQRPSIHNSLIHTSAWEVA